MQATFIKDLKSKLNFRPYLVEATASAFNSAAPSYVNAIASALNQLEQTDQMYLNTVPAFSITELVSDEEVTRPHLYFNDISTLLPVDLQVANNILSVYQDFIAYYGGDFMDITLTNGKMVALKEDGGSLFAYYNNGERRAPILYIHDGQVVASAVIPYTSCDGTGDSTEVTTWAQVAASINQAYLMNEVLREGLLFLRDSENKTPSDLNTFFASKKELVNSSYNYVTNMVNDFISVLTQYGPIGLFRRIMDYFKAATTVQYSDSELVFTDNGALVPAQYIAGMVTTILATAGAIVTAIVAIVSPALAIAGALLTTVFSAIPKAIEYDWANNVTARFKNDFNTLDCHPFAIMQHVVNTEDLHLSQAALSMIQYMKESGVPIAVEFPGGYLFIGKHVGGNSSALRIEFHPSTNNYLPFLDSYGLRGVILDQPSIVSYGYVTTYSDFYLRGSDLEWFMNNLQARVPYYSSSNQDSLSRYDDECMRLYLASAVTVFFLYLLLLHLNRFNIVTEDSYIYLAHGHIVQPMNEQHAIALFRVLSNWSYSNVFWQNLFSCIPYGNRPIDGMFNIEEGDYTVSYPHQQPWEAILSWISQLSYTKQSSSVEYNKLYRVWSYYGKENDGIHEFQLKFYSDGEEYFFHTANLLDSLFQSPADYGALIPLDRSYGYTSSLPKYDSSSFWVWVVLAVVATSIVAGIAAFTALYTQYKIRKINAINAAKVERAHQQFYENPTNENLAAYKRTVLKNNLVATVTGGQTFKWDDFWGFSSDESSSASNVSYLAALSDKSQDSLTIIKLIAGE